MKRSRLWHDARGLHKVRHFIRIVPPTAEKTNVPKDIILRDVFRVGRGVEPSDQPNPRAGKMTVNATKAQPARRMIPSMIAMSFHDNPGKPNLLGLIRGRNGV